MHINSEGCHSIEKRSDQKPASEALVFSLEGVLIKVGFWLG